MKNVFGKSMVVLGLVVGLANASSFAMGPKQSDGGSNPPSDPMADFGCNFQGYMDWKFEECVIYKHSTQGYYNVQEDRYISGDDYLLVDGKSKYGTINFCRITDTPRNRRAYDLKLTPYLQSLGICEKVTSKLFDN